MLGAHQLVSTSYKTDVTHPLDRVLLMKQPRGLPGVDPEAMLLVRVPVYGLCDSGRGFWLRLDDDAKTLGMTASKDLSSILLILRLKPRRWLQCSRLTLMILCSPICQKVNP